VHEVKRMVIAAPPTQGRFRKIAESPTNTRIGIAAATATDARGANLTLVIPDLAIVPLFPARTDRATRAFVTGTRGGYHSARMRPRSPTLAPPSLVQPGLNARAME